MSAILVCALREKFLDVLGMGAVQVVKVADFGVARVQAQSGIMTAETGTYRWMAPEVSRALPGSCSQAPSESYSARSC